MTESDHAEVDVEAVAAELRIVTGALIRRLRVHRAPGDPTVGEGRVLARLDREGPATSADLARREQVSPQAMGVTIAGLMERGLLDRAADPSDGRRIMLTLSPAGVEALTDRRHHSSRALADAMSAALSPDEVVAVAEILPLLDRVGDAL